MKLDWNLSYGQVFKSPLVLAEELAKPFEKCSLKAYWDCAGYPTNGWGNLLSRVRLQTIMQQKGWTREQADTWLHETYPNITQEQADSDFRINLNKAFASVKRLVKIPLSSDQIASLIDFAFNLGAGNLQTSTLLRMINRGDILDAAEEFKKWDKAGGVVYRGLTRRCLARYNLYLRT